MISGFASQVAVGVGSAGTSGRSNSEPESSGRAFTAASAEEESFAPFARKPEVWVHTGVPPGLPSASSTKTSVTMSMSRPLRWVRRFSARVRTVSTSSTVSGRVCVMSLVRCTAPTALNGKSGVAMTFIASGNDSTYG